MKIFTMPPKNRRRPQSKEKMGEKSEKLSCPGIIPGILFAVFFFLALSGAKTTRAASDALQIDIYGPGQSKANLYIAPLQVHNNGTWEKVGQIVRKYVKKDLSLLPFLNQVNGTQLVGKGPVSGVQARDIDFRRLGLSEADILLTSLAREKKNALAAVEIRAYNVFSGKMIVGKGYTLRNKGQIPLAARKFSADLLRELTGDGSFYRTRIAFVRKHSGKSKNICLTSVLGEDVRQVTDFEGVSTSPAISGDGKRLVFSYLGKKRHKMGVWNRENGEIETRMIPGTICISPVFRPDGKVVASLNPHGNPDICTLSPDMRIGEFLVQNWGIDVSPSFDKSGEKMAFVSSRLGNPHIFLLNRKKDKIKRVTYSGKYNTSPSINPEGNLIAYSGRTKKGHRIFVHDLRTGMDRRVTFGPGDDEEPSFGPAGHFIVFSSSRSGRYKLYLTTVNADEPKKIPVGPGEMTTPFWSWAVEDF